ncbi:MAG: HDIG domain-containing protein [Elusimicrobia bacterium]|nr:HDIG domain-containing protein [Elusimicrobiota bacterium]
MLVTLRVFELLFEELTNFTLLELSDSLNQPLLRRLAFEAPGTYHHSLLLSNIASAAADAIGANQLLVRVGAYYHDIGKLEKPQYFTENQMMADNKHDQLEPSVSRLVILNHVKEGVEIAKKERLSPRIIDFIRQHHGTSLMHYFYQRAIESEGAEKVDEASYRYPGPKPQTKEVAIVMLADAVEGATRAMDERSPAKIEEVVRRVINNKFIDGQFDDCNLTLREIEKIASAFTRTLSAMYHIRVKYPDASKKNS